MIQWISGKVVENFQWSDSVFSLRVITESFDFKAGQFVRLGLNVGGEQVLRACWSPVHRKSLFSIL